MEHVYLRVKCTRGGQVIDKCLFKLPSNSDGGQVSMMKFKIDYELEARGYKPSLVSEIVNAYGIWSRQATKTYKTIVISEDKSVTAEIRRG